MACIMTITYWSAKLIVATVINTQCITICKKRKLRYKEACLVIGIMRYNLELFPIAHQVQRGDNLTVDKQAFEYPEILMHSKELSRELSKKNHEYQILIHC